MVGIITADLLIYKLQPNYSTFYCYYNFCFSHSTHVKALIVESAFKIQPGQPDAPN